MRYRSIADVDLQDSDLEVVRSDEPRVFESPVDDRVGQLAGEIDHLGACFEQLLDIVGDQEGVDEAIAPIRERIGFFERRILRIEDAMAEVSRLMNRDFMER